MGSEFSQPYADSNETLILKQRFEEQRLVSVSCPCPGLDPMMVFGVGLGQARFFWADSQIGVTYVGLGLAADLQAWGRERFRATATDVQALFDDAHITAVDGQDVPKFAEPQLFGGFAFSGDFTPDNTWSIYHPAEFVLPHYQLAVRRLSAHSDDERGAAENEVWLTLNTLVDTEEDAGSIAGPLREALEARVAELRDLAEAKGEARAQYLSKEYLTKEHLSIKYPMEYAQWAQMMEAALAEFAAKRLQKVVLSRVCEIRFGKNVDVDGALAFLNERYPDCTRFVFEPRAHHAFFGASPETLVRLEGRKLTTMGLAGSAPRGKSPDEDAAFGQGLLDSAKDQHEHKVVVDSIRRRLAPICAELDIPNEPDLLKLGNIQHLFTPILGQLANAKTIFDMVALLHPTPALGGAPQVDALTFIDVQEPVPRGWYGAPVGVVNRAMEGTFCVAIRSAVSEYERVWLHAGAGIVAGSDPQMEWDEIGLKFRPILNSLGVEGQSKRDTD